MSNRSQVLGLPRVGTDMIASLSHHCARWLNLRVHHVSLSKSEGEDALIELNLASSLVPVDLSWSHARALCEKGVLGLKRVLEQDIDRVSKLLSELDPLAEVTEDPSRSQVECPEPRGSPSIRPAFIPQGLRSSDPITPDRRTRKRRRSSTLQEPVVIRPTDAFAPIIIITPCPSQSRETSCWVPYQDASFGTRLTVPTYAALNSVHPPMVAPANNVVMQIDDWEYTRGHWRAVIPLPDEQCKRGLFSRATLPRKRALCPRFGTDGSFL